MTEKSKFDKITGMRLHTPLHKYLPLRGKQAETLVAKTNKTSQPHLFSVTHTSPTFNAYFLSHIIRNMA